MKLLETIITLITIVFIIASTAVITNWYDNKRITTVKYEYPSVETIARFTNYLIIDKYDELEESNDTLTWHFYLILQNPYTTKKYKVKINDALYYNQYYIGETIKEIKQ